MLHLRDTLGQSFDTYVKPLLAVGKHKGLSPAEICKRAGVHRSQYYRWIGGKSNPSLRVLHNIQRVVEAPNEQ